MGALYTERGICQNSATLLAAEAADAEIPNGDGFAASRKTEKNVSKKTVINLDQKQKPQIKQGE